MNGRVMPLAGSRLRLTPRLTIACRPNCASRPAAASSAKRSPTASVRAQPAQQDEGEQAEQREAGEQAELLGDHREDEVAVRVRQRVFDRALARAAAEPGRALDRLQREADLVVVAARPDRGSGRCAG